MVTSYRKGKNSCLSSQVNVYNIIWACIEQTTLSSSNQLLICINIRFAPCCTSVVSMVYFGCRFDSARRRPWLIGGPGATPRKIRPMLVSKWPNIGHIRVQIRIYGHKWPLYHVGTTYKCPRISRGDLRGLSPRNSHRLPPKSRPSSSRPHLAPAGMK